MMIAAKPRREMSATHDVDFMARAAHPSKDGVRRASRPAKSERSVQEMAHEAEHGGPRASPKRVQGAHVDGRAGAQLPEESARLGGLGPPDPGAPAVARDAEGTERLRDHVERPAREQPAPEVDVD